MTPHLTYRAQRALMASYPMGEEIPDSGERKPLRTRQIVSREHLAAVVAWLDENKIEDGDFAIDLHLRLSETTARRYLASQPGGLLRNEEVKDADDS